jgi:uncharacterized protein YndB with AHSA1/START domain
MARNEIKLVRMFNAPRELVFQAWTEPKYIREWWGPEGFTCPHATVDLKVGGKFHFSIKGMGMEHWVIGEYREIVKPSKIVSVMYFADKDGNKRSPAEVFGPGADAGFPYETIDVVTFEQVGQQTRLTLVRNHPEDVAKKFREIEGWNSSLNKFEKQVSR